MVGYILVFWRWIKINEKKLIKLIKHKNNKSAASELIQIYYKDIFLYVYKQTQNEELSKDLTQDIFISMLKSIYSFDERKASFRTWLYKIASNKIIDTYRSTYYKYVTLVDEYDELITPYDNSFEDLFEIKEDANRALDILKTFNTNIQQIVRLKIFGDMTFSEIGAVLELPESTIKTRYYTAVKNIRKMREVKKNG